MPASTTLSSRELNQDIGRAKRAALHGPVIITDRGKPAHVLLSIEEYERLIQAQSPVPLQASRTLGESLHMPGVDEVDLDAVLAPRSISSRPMADLD